MVCENLQTHASINEFVNSIHIKLISSALGFDFKHKLFKLDVVPSLNKRLAKQANRFSCIWKRFQRSVTCLTPSESSEHFELPWPGSPLSHSAPRPSRVNKSLACTPLRPARLRLCDVTPRWGIAEDCTGSCLTNLEACAPQLFVWSKFALGNCFVVSRWPSVHFWKFKKLATAQFAYEFYCAGKIAK